MNADEKATTFLEHFGVKGMRWGVRRSRSELSKGKTGSTDKPDEKAAPKPKKVVGKTRTSDRRAEDLSDANLKKVVNRINMEKQFDKLTAPPPTVAQRTAKFFAEIAVNVAKTQITALANKQAANLIGNMMSAKSSVKIPKVNVPLPSPNPLTKVG